jgi:capsular polysaccharide biosynthesis protein
MRLLDRQFARRIPEPAIYAGPRFVHFGHFVAECIHRLYARKVFPELSAAKVAFISPTDHTVEPWLEDVLWLCGVDINDVVFVDRPTHFRELHVPAQGRVLGGHNLIAGYGDYFPLRRPEEEPRTDGGLQLYLSRSRHRYSGSYLGESLIETLLQEAGFEIVHPEHVRPRELVARLMSAKTCIFAEGSAIHNLELCGRIPARVGIISRQPGSHERFHRVVEQTASELCIFNRIRDSGFPLDWDMAQDRPSIQRACAVLDIAGLVADIAAFTGKALPMPSDDAIRNSVLADLARYILDPRTTRAKTSNEKLGLLLRELQKRRADFER